MGVLGLFKPLLQIDRSFLHMYGMLESVFVSCKLNPWNESVIKKCISSKSVINNRAGVNSDVSYNYMQIESLIREKSFNSVFVRSDVEPFHLRVILPYEIVHSLSSLRNESCLQKSNAGIEGDVSFEHNVKMQKVGLLLASVDPRDYIFPDDYVPSSYAVDLYSIIGAEYDDIVIPAAGFYDTIGSRIADTVALTKKDYKFISLYDKS